MGFWWLAFFCYWIFRFKLNSDFVLLQLFYIFFQFANFSQTCIIFVFKSKETASNIFVNGGMNINLSLFDFKISNLKLRFPKSDIPCQHLSLVLVDELKCSISSFSLFDHLIQFRDFNAQFLYVLNFLFHDC